MNELDSKEHRRSESKKHRKKEKKHKKAKKHKSNKEGRKKNDDTKRRLEEEETATERISVPVANPEENALTERLTASMPEVEESDIFGPALPPHLLPKESDNKVRSEIVIGPILPQGIGLGAHHLPSEPDIQSDDDDGAFGPRPVDDGSLKSMTTAEIELEQRALEMKLAKLDPEANKVDANVREEWMLELPDVGIKTGLASLKRTFHTKERPDFSDRSCWTKTPKTSDTPSTSKVTESSKSKAEKLYQAARDAEQEKIAKKLKKKHKRDESLYEIHQKKLKKEEKEKQLSGQAERKPFSRETDLQINKIDRNQTKSIVDKAKFLDSRFSSGNTKYL